MFDHTPTTVFLVRHGETIWHAENQYAGSSDVALTERGVEQGESLGRWAATARLDAVVASDLSRARLTAAPAAENTGLPVLIEPELREVDFGDGEGLTRSQMAEVFPEPLAEWLAAPATLALPGGESGVAAIARAYAALVRIVKEHPGGRVLIVGHSTLARLLMCELLGIQPNNYRSVFPAIDNCAINELKLTVTEDGDGLSAALMRFNLPTSGF